MQIIDYVILAFAVIGLIVGLVRGFIGQLLALLGIVAVAVGTSYLFMFPQQWLAGIITDEKLLAIVSIVLTAIALTAIYAVIAILVKKPFKSINVMKTIDKLIGGVLGVVVVYALVALFVEALTRPDIEFMASIKELLAPQTENSVIIKTVYANNFFGKWIFDVISEGIKQVLAVV